MKKYILAALLLSVIGCSEVENSNNLSVQEICTKREAIKERREDYKNVFLQCMNSPKRLQTGTDDEADVVTECRITASSLYDVDYKEDEFMKKTDTYHFDCLKFNQRERK